MAGGQRGLYGRTCVRTVYGRQNVGTGVRAPGSGLAVEQRTRCRSGPWLHRCASSYEGAFYDVTARGNAPAAVYQDVRH